METGENLILLETLIIKFAQAQFEANKIPLIMQRFVMRSVYGTFEDALLNSIMENSLDHSQQEAGKTGEEGNTNG